MDNWWADDPVAEDTGGEWWAKDALADAPKVGADTAKRATPPDDVVADTPEPPAPDRTDDARAGRSRYDAASTTACALARAIGTPQAPVIAADPPGPVVP